MKRIYKNETKLRLLVDTKCDLSGYEDVTLCLRKPDDSLVSFAAVVKDVEKGVVFYDVQSVDDFDQSGWWSMWPEVRFDDDRTAYGRAVQFFVYEKGAS